MKRPKWESRCVSYIWVYISDSAAQTEEESHRYPGPQLATDIRLASAWAWKKPLTQ